MKQFVKTLHKDGECIHHIMCQSSKLPETKLEDGIFNGLQIRPQ